MSHIAFFVYGLAAYSLFFAAIVYGIGFVADLYVAKGIDDGIEGPLGVAITINVGLLLLFALQHNVMARPRFKEWWTKFVPRPIERSTFVAAASLILMLLYWQWRPMPTIVWHVDSTVGRDVLWALYFTGWGLVFYSSFLIDHFELFGLRQVWSYSRGKEHTSATFSERLSIAWCVTR